MTPREALLTARLLAGQEPAALAEELGVTSHTLTFHLKRIYRKAGVSGRAELMRALSRGLADWSRPRLQ